MQIISLSEGSFTVDESKNFIPFHRNKGMEKPKGSIIVSIHPFVVITDKDVILLDAGLGAFAEDGMLQIYKNLKANGIEAGDVTKVLLSHLHKDHSGGLLNPYTGFFSFENATCYVQERELDFSVSKNSLSYKSGITEMLRSYDNLELLHDDTGVIDGYIYYELTQAHSLYHQVFWIRENEEIIFYGADDAPQLVQMKHSFSAKYDYDGKKANTLREKWWEKGETEKWHFLFYHDNKTPHYQHH